MSQVIKGTIQLDVVADRVTSTLISPPFVAGKVFELISGEIIIDIPGGATTEIPVAFCLSNKEQTAGKTVGALFIDDEIVAMALPQDRETSGGGVDIYIAGRVPILPNVLGDVVLNQEFYINLMDNNLDASGGIVVASYKLVIDDVKTSTKTQQALLESM